MSRNHCGICRAGEASSEARRHGPEISVARAIAQPSFVTVAATRSTRWVQGLVSSADFSTLRRGPLR